MDEPSLDPTRHFHALQGLSRINFISRSDRILWGDLLRLSQSQTTPLRILDIATGAGDVPIRLFKRFRRAGIAVEISGCDLSATAIQLARANATTAAVPVQFFQHDVIGAGVPTGYDAITCSLFLHHLDEDVAIRLLASMLQSAGKLILLQDLVRSRFAYLLAYLGARVLSRSTVVHVDGPLSVRGAFTVAEARLLAERAGLEGASITRRCPCRFLLSWSRP